MARQDQVFNSFKRRKLLRKHIPSGEAGVGLLVLGALLGAGLWVRLQRDAWDPGERDISLAVLEQDAVRDTLYKTPLQLWRDPAEPAGAPSAAADLGPFPAALLEGGWRVAGRPQSFTPETLYEKIDGQAEQYLKFGCRGLDVLALQGPDGGPGLDVYLFDQGSFADALGLYAEQRGGRPLEVRGPLWRTPTPVGAYGLVGRYVFQLIGSEAGPALQAKVEQVLAALAEALREPGAPPHPYRLLQEGLGLPPERLAYLPINAFQLDFAERFWFGQLAPDGVARVFVHEAPEAGAAAALFARLDAEQAKELDRLEAPPEVAVFRHPFLNTFFAFRCRASLLVGVEDAPTREEALAVLDRLGQALEAGEEEPR